MQKIFSSDGEAMEIVFFHNRTLPLPVKRNFHLGLGCTQERKELLLKTLHML